MYYHWYRSQKLFTITIGYKLNASLNRLYTSPKLYVKSWRTKHCIVFDT